MSTPLFYTSRGERAAFPVLVSSLTAVKLPSPSSALTMGAPSRLVPSTPPRLRRSPLPTAPTLPPPHAPPRPHLSSVHAVLLASAVAVASTRACPRPVGLLLVVGPGADVRLAPSSRSWRTHNLRTAMAARGSAYAMLAVCTSPTLRVVGLRPRDARAAVRFVCARLFVACVTVVANARPADCNGSLEATRTQ